MKYVSDVTSSLKGTEIDVSLVVDSQLKAFRTDVFKGISILFNFIIKCLDLVKGGFTWLNKMLISI